MKSVASSLVRRPAYCSGQLTDPARYLLTSGYTSNPLTCLDTVESESLRVPMYTRIRLKLALSKKTRQTRQTKHGLVAIVALKLGVVNWSERMARRQIRF